MKMSHRFNQRQVALILATAGLILSGCQGDPTFPTAPVKDAGVELRDVARSSSHGSSKGGGLVGGVVSAALDVVDAIVVARPNVPDPVGSQTFHLVGARGGSFTYGRYTVRFPSGAVNGDGDVTITVSDGTAMGCEFSISPASLNGFSKQVHVSMDCRHSSVNALNAGTLGTWWQVPGGWVAVPSSYSLSDWSEESDLWHFSTYRAGWSGQK